MCVSMISSKFYDFLSMIQILLLKTHDYCEGSIFDDFGLLRHLGTDSLLLPLSNLLLCYSEVKCLPIGKSSTIYVFITDS